PHAQRRPPDRVAQVVERRPADFGHREPDRLPARAVTYQPERPGEAARREGVLRHLLELVELALRAAGEQLDDHTGDGGAMHLPLLPFAAKGEEAGRHPEVVEVD